MHMNTQTNSFCEQHTLTVHLDNGTPLPFCWIPSGSFLMGSPDTEEGHEESESPLHRVVMPNGFRMTCTPITRDQWMALMGPSAPPEAKGTYPMTDVSWQDAQQFVAKLSAVFATESVRLPTEAEWEYACRAGSEGRYANGDKESDLDRMAWYAGNSGGAPHPVGQKEPNAWGLHDMHGNVFEWCQDWDGPYPTDNSGPLKGEKRILRGGCYKCPPPYCRSANRYSAPPDRRGSNFGFRIVLTRK